MSSFEQPSRRHRARRRSPWPRRLLTALAITLAFALGVALSRALGDGPEPGVTQTSIRTLEPLPQRPAETR